jgi:hypothetical protein
MLSDESNASQHGLSWTEHVAVLAGGAFGGCTGLTLVAYLLVPGVYSLNMEALQCCGFGLVAGYLPGIGACWAALQLLNRTSARVVGFLAGAASAAIFSGLVAAFFGAAAHV